VEEKNEKPETAPNANEVSADTATVKVNAAEELIANTGTTETQPGAKKPEETEDKNKIFRKYKIKDIVFLAIMAAVMLVTGAIMPLIGQIPLFGIVQLCLGLQFSVFPTVGMMKVRKPGALLFMSVCCGAVLIFMNTVMFVSLLICAAIAEGLALLIFRGYKKDAACLLAGTVFFPCSLPFLYVWYKLMYTWTGEEGKAVNAFVGSSPGVAIGMSVAVLALCFVGALAGMLISRELRKSGVMKK